MSESPSPPQEPAKALTTEAPSLPARRPTLEIGTFGIELRNLDELWRFAGMVAASGFAPKGMDQNQAACAVAIQLGLELGIGPAAAIQNIAPINGRPGIFGDMPLALVRNTGQLEDFDEWLEHNGQRVKQFPLKPDDTTTAFCLVKRKGSRERLQGYSVADAKTARLWGKDSPWSTAPARMLMFRARGFALRDTFGDTLKGIKTQEELQDFIEVEQVTEAPIAMPQPAAAPAPGEVREAAAEQLASEASGSAPSNEEGKQEGPAPVKIVTAKKTKTGIRDDQTPYTRWTVTTSEGVSLDTEDQAVYAALAKAHIEQRSVHLTIEPGEKNARVVAVTLA